MLYDVSSFGRLLNFTSDNPFMFIERILINMRFILFGCGGSPGPQSLGRRCLCTYGEGSW